MNEALKEIINRIKQELHDRPDGVIAGEINNGFKGDMITDNPVVYKYFEFLKETNGASFGDIDFYDYDRILKYQFRVLSIPGGEDKWFCIGQILYEPMVLNKTDSKVYRFYQGFESSISGTCFGYFDDFLKDYVFGKKYADIIPDAEDDEWYQLLKKIKLA